MHLSLGASSIWMLAMAFLLAQIARYACDPTASTVPEVVEGIRDSWLICLLGLVKRGSCSRFAHTVGLFDMLRSLEARALEYVAWSTAGTE